MFIKLKFKILNIGSENDKAQLETEIDVLEGVKNVNIDSESGESWVEFDSNKISQEEIFGKIEELKFQIEKEGLESQPMRKEHIYFVKGTHCASCEVLIEKKLAALREIKSVEASADKDKVFVVYQGQRPSVKGLNSIFRKEGYRFFDEPVKITEQKNGDFL